MLRHNKEKISYDITYNFDHNDSDFLIYLINQGQVLNYSYLKAIKPLMIINLHQTKSSYQSLIIDQHNQKWLCPDSLETVADMFFQELAVAYDPWQNYLCQINRTGKENFPYVYGNHIYLRIPSSNQMTHHWLNLSQCKYINYDSYQSPRKFHFYFKDLEASEFNFKFSFLDPHAYLQDQISLAYQLNKYYNKSFKYLIDSLQFSSYDFPIVNHPCFSLLDPHILTSKSLNIQKEDLMSLINYFYQYNHRLNSESLALKSLQAFTKTKINYKAPLKTDNYKRIYKRQQRFINRSIRFSN